MAVRTARAVFAAAVLAFFLTPVVTNGQDTTTTPTMQIGDLFKTGDWHTQTHIPVIDCPDIFIKGEATPVTITVGKAIPHPNTTVHHIRWVKLYFLPDGSDYAFEVGVVDFSTHGGSIEGPDTSTLYTKPEATIEFMTGKPGALYAVTDCNIHGLWWSSKRIEVQ